MSWKYVVSGILLLVCVGLIVSQLSLFRWMNQTPAVISDITYQQVLQFYRDNPSASYVTAASHLNITRQTVSRHIGRLLENGKIFREGDRFVIPDSDTREFA